MFVIIMNFSLKFAEDIGTRFKKNVAAIIIFQSRESKIMIHLELMELILYP